MTKKKNICLLYHAFKRKLFNCIGLRGRKMNIYQKNFYPRHTAAYVGLASEICSKGRGACNRRILCEVTGGDDQKRKKILENTK